MNTLIALGVIYLALLVSLNLLLGTKGSLGWISWNSIHRFTYHTRRFRISLDKLQLKVNPMGAFYREPILTVVLSGADIYRLREDMKSEPARSSSRKTNRRVLKLLGRLPLAIELQNVQYTDRVLIEVECAKAQIMSNALQFSSGSVKIGQRKVINRVLGSVSLDDYTVTLNVKNVTLDVDELERFIPKSNKHAKSEELPSQPLALPFRRISMECENASLTKDNYCLFLETVTFALGKLDEEEITNMNFLDQHIYEVLFGISNFKLTQMETNKMLLFLPFLNIFSLCNLRDILEIQKNKDDKEFIDRFAATRRFLFKTTVSATNLVLNSDINDLVKSDRKNGTRPKKTIEIPSYLQNLLPKIKIRIQLMSSVVNIAVAEELTVKARVEDIAFDTSLANTYDSLFSGVSGSVHKMIGFLIRNIQFSFVEPDKTSKFFYLDHISATVSFGTRKGCLFGQTDILVGTVEVLLAELSAFQKLYAHKIDIGRDPDANSHSSSEGGNSLIERISLKVQHMKFVSCFETPVKYYNGVDQSEMNRYKRGVFVEASELEVEMDLVMKKLDVELQFFKAKLVKDYDTEQYSGELEEFINIENPHLKYFKDKHQLSLSLPLVDTELSAEVLWSVLFVKTILTSVIPSLPKRKKVSTQPPLKYLFGIQLFMMKIRLPNDIDLVLELDRMEALSTVEDDCHARFRALRLYGRSPYASQTWSLIFILSDANTTIRINSQAEHLAVINSRSVRFEIPFEYVFFETFDNFRALTKAITKMEANFRHLMSTPESELDFNVPILMPSKVESPFKFPSVRLNAKQFQFCMHDDPFEAELHQCFLLGRIEQMMRNTKLATFEKYEKQIREKLQREYTALTFVNGEPLKPTNFNSNSTGKVQHTHVSSQLANEVFSDDIEQYNEYLKKVKELIELPRLRLLSNLSKSWIFRVKEHREVSESAHLKRLSSIRGGEDPPVSAKFMEKYPVITACSAAPLFSFELANLRWDLSEPSFGLENYKHFLHKVGQGMPYDMEYGILFPVNMHITCSRLTIQLKDYPIPFISFGGGDEDTPQTVSFKGDFVIAEQMYVAEELRYNFVPFVSQYNDPKCTDNMFASHVSRTMTNVKFFTDMRVHVNSSKNVIVSWYSAIQPALLYAMDSFDVLSKPPLDPSPKLGFWDKFALLLHANFHFTFTNGIHLFIKSQNSPYDLMGQGAGFVFRWKDKVDLKINGTGRSDELLVVESKEFDVVIPRFSRSNLTYLLDDKNPYELDYITEKKVWKLSSQPVVWKLGFLFERNESAVGKYVPGQVKRTSKFKPHYQVRLRNPSTFTNDKELGSWDSYEGFRSHYIHMCVSLESSSSEANSYNSIHLTPLAFSHFFTWWNTFRSSLGLPIKHGKMFKNKFLDYRPSPKFGKHLFSISYSLKLKPLYLTHVYIHPTDIRANSNLAFTGLKCSIESFGLDLHQLKCPTSTSENPDFSLQFNQGEVDFVNTDLRLLVAEFNERSAVGMLAREIGITESSSFMDVTSSSVSERPAAEDVVWFDMDDFVEVDTPKIKPKNPQWKATPLASSTRFCYFLQEKEPELQYTFAAIQERTHNCFVGRNHPERTPFAVANKRAAELKEQIKTHETSLGSLQSNPDKSQSIAKRIEELEQEIKDLNTRLHVTRCLRDSFEAGMIPDYDEFLDENEGSDVETSYTVSRVNSKISRRSCNPTVRSTAPSSPPASSFRNRFIIYHVVFRWSSHTKKKFASYIDNVSERKSLVFNLSRRAIKLAEELYESQSLPRKAGRFDDRESLDMESCPNFYNFERKLRESDELEDVDFDDTYLLKFILPQLCFDTEMNSAVLVTSKEITVSSISVDFKQHDDEESIPIESRNGIILRDAFFYVLDKDKTLSGHYKLFWAQSTWPPQLPVEMYYCSNLLANTIVIWNVSMGSIFIKPNKLRYMKTDQCNVTKFRELIQVMAPEIVVTANSQQYNVIYNLAMSFMDSNMTEKQKMKEKIKSLVKFSVSEDFGDIKFRMFDLQQKAWLLSDCKKFMLMMQGNAPDQDDVLQIEVELEKIYLELGMLVSYLQHTKAMKYNDSYEERQWVLNADNVRLELLDSDDKKFIIVEAKQSCYQTEQRPDGASRNRVLIQDFVAEDLQPHTKYKTIVEKIHKEGSSDMPMVFVDWTMLEAVGGIPVVEHKSITFAPLKIEVDFKTAVEIYKFVYPKQVSDLDTESSDDESSSIVDSVSAETPSSRTSFDSSSSIFSDRSANGEGKLKKMGRMLSKRKHDRQGSPTSTTSEFSSIHFLGHKNNENADEKQYISQMVERSKKYQLLNRITIDPLHLVLSFKGQGSYKVVDVHRLELEIPKVEYTNKMWSQEDFFQRFKKDVVRHILKNTGKIMANKITKRQKRSKLQQLLSYKVDLQSELSRRTSVSSSTPKLHSHLHRHKDHFGHYEDPDVLEPRRHERPLIDETVGSEIQNFEPLEEISEESV
ncbi:hypothetical protein KL951_001692 [Ogataea haglerorum]|uniref:Uncharacterized protein n=1 Tax=Ogataea haglerorum TaxID=1937702 RepID=A0ABQ7RFS9_9ASCO|nr:hypothetical protein KL951_001692 [Ogataea haglerorum]KAG7764886.1 hypothetical protein KL946_002753 [Ogataea haglerorum]